MHLPHIPSHRPAPPLCMLRLVFPPKTHLFTLHKLFFLLLQALELVLCRPRKGLSRCVCFCRFPPLCTTHLNYNFANSYLLFLSCAGKWTLVLTPPLLGRRRQSPKQGARPSFCARASMPPFSPHPSPLFALFARSIVPH